MTIDATPSDDRTLPAHVSVDAKGIAWLRLQNPPVNALDAETRQRLADCLAYAFGAARAVVIHGAERHFSAGLDLSEILATEKPPTLNEICAAIDAAPIPVVALIEGAAISGGAVLALACHYRIAGPGAALGFPEYRLGLLPTAGGLVRLARIAGAGVALAATQDRMILGPDATAHGAVFDHRIGTGDLDAASAFVAGLIREGAPPRPISDRREGLAAAGLGLAAVSDWRRRLTTQDAQVRGRAADVAEAALLLPVAQALAVDAETATQCRNHPQSVALRHLFSAERRADPALVSKGEDGRKALTDRARGLASSLTATKLRAAKALCDLGFEAGAIDGAMVSWGFASGPFGTSGTSTDPAAEDEIRLRLLAAMMSEGARAVTSGQARRPADIDVVAVQGAGFPRLLGGPMRAAQTVGLLRLKQKMTAWMHEDRLWAPPPLLLTAIQTADGFDAANRG